jgi:hypothetical protein
MAANWYRTIPGVSIVFTHWCGYTVSYTNELARWIQLVAISMHQDSVLSRNTSPGAKQANKTRESSRQQKDAATACQRTPLQLDRNRFPCYSLHRNRFHNKRTRLEQKKRSRSHSVLFWLEMSNNSLLSGHSIVSTRETGLERIF